MQWGSFTPASVSVNSWRWKSARGKTNAYWPFWVIFAHVFLCIDLGHESKLYRIMYSVLSLPIFILYHRSTIDCQLATIWAWTMQAIKESICVLITAKCEQAWGVRSEEDLGSAYSTSKLNLRPCGRNWSRGRGQGCVLLSSLVPNEAQFRLGGFLSHPVFLVYIYPIYPAILYSASSF